MKSLKYGFLGLPFLLAACVSAPLATAVGNKDVPAETLASPGRWLGGMALPAGSAIRVEQSLIMGPGDNWMGRVVLDVGRDAEAAYRFFMDQLVAQGWTIVTSVRGRQSLLVFSRQERTLTIEMNETMIGSPSVVMTMAPRHNAGMPVMPAAPVVPAGPAAAATRP